MNNKEKSPSEDKGIEMMDFSGENRIKKCINVFMAGIGEAWAKVRENPVNTLEELRENFVTELNNIDLEAVAKKHGILSNKKDEDLNKKIDKTEEVMR